MLANTYPEDSPPRALDAKAAAVAFGRNARRRRTNAHGPWVKGRVQVKLHAADEGSRSRHVSLPARSCVENIHVALPLMRVVPCVVRHVRGAHAMRVAYPERDEYPTLGRSKGTQLENRRRDCTTAKWTREYVWVRLGIHFSQARAAERVSILAIERLRLGHIVQADGALGVIILFVGRQAAWLIRLLLEKHLH